jgi:thiol:disulfide interchange protein DsbC
MVSRLIIQDKNQEHLVKKVLGIALIVSLIAPISAVFADNAKEVAVIKKALANIIPTKKPDVVSPSAIPGIYEVVYGAQIMYISADARYFVQGDVIDLKNRVNLTETTRTVQRKKLVKKMDESKMIVFNPKGKVKHTISVFTDIDCGYCRKLHREIDTYLNKGIKVRYLSYPRSGPNTKSYYKAITVWCSKNKQEALTRSKSGENLPRKNCDNPVDEHMKMADDFGVSGTPTIVLENGEVIPGYVPADRLEKILDQGV